MLTLQIFNSKVVEHRVQNGNHCTLRSKINNWNCLRIVVESKSKILSESRAKRKY
jgi:hypothetical protein